MKRFTAHFNLLIVLLFLFSGVAKGESPYPKAEGFVSDYTGSMSRSDRAMVDQLCREIQQKAKIELAFVVMDTIPDGQDIALYATELGHNWGVGTKGSDRGALTLYKTGTSDGQRQIHISTGYGLEGDLPDSKVGRILDQVTIPYLRQNQLGQAFAATAVTLTGIVAPDVQLTGAPTMQRQMARRGQEDVSPVGMVIMIILVMIMMSTRFGRAMLFGMLLSGMFGGRRGGWGGGGGFGGGGFGGGFGGGGFGGGGAGRSF
ncbi:TPM domain-containing protein [bacterium]|nr:TPM domain-containing protein [bacterium]